MKSNDVFLENLALLISSGMPVFEALTSLAEEVRGRSAKRLALWLADEVKSGEMLSDALGKTRLFPERYVGLVRLGEETGHLSDQLRLIVADMRKERQFRSKVENALVYPGIVCLVTVGVGIISVWFTLPKLIDVISQIGGTVPLSTRVVIAIGAFFRDYGFEVVPPTLGVLILLAVLLFAWKRTKVSGELALSVFPVAQSVVTEIEVARLGHAMGVLLSAGLDLPQSLEYLEQSTPRILYARLYAAAAKDVIDGVALSDALSRQRRARRLLPPHVFQLIAAGERSGSLPETFTTLGELYQEKMDNATSNVGAILEPAIVVVIGLAVAFVAMAIITPIYGLVNQIGP